MADTHKSYPLNRSEQDRQLEELLFLAWMYFQMKRSQPSSGVSGRASTQVA